MRTTPCGSPGRASASDSKNHTASATEVTTAKGERQLSTARRKPKRLKDRPLVLGGPSGRSEVRPASSSGAGGSVAEFPGATCCAHPGCGRPLPPSAPGKRGPRRRYCDEHATPQARKARSRDRGREEAALLISRKRKPEPIGQACGSYDDPEPGSAEWCDLHGIDVGVWRARGVWRYHDSSHDRECVKEPFRSALSAEQFKRLSGKISSVVRQSPGQLMPKHPLPGNPPIPPQLRPDHPVITDHRFTWHYHGPAPEPGEWPCYPVEAGEHRVGKKLIPVGEMATWMLEKVGEIAGPDGETLHAYTRVEHAPKFGYVISAGEVERHINRVKEEPYDPATGEGDHHGDNPDFVHKHAPHKAKYVLFGDNKRIDVHPWVPKMLKKAKRVLFVMEGTPKNDSCVSAGEAVISVPSVTLWDANEVAGAVRWVRTINPDAPFVVVPDADGIFNSNVRRQALFLRSCIRRNGAQAYIAAPYAEEDIDECKCTPFSTGAGSLTRAELAGLESPGDYLREVHRRLIETNGASYVRGVCLDCGGYFKGCDDWRFADGMIDMMVIGGREAPVTRIAVEMIERMRVPAGRRPLSMRRRAFWALEGLSLHANYDPKEKIRIGGSDEDLPIGGIYLPLRMLARVMGTYPEAVVETLLDLADAVEIRGSLETKVKPWAHIDESTGEIRVSIVRDWKERPSIVVNPDFQADEPRPQLLGEITDGPSATELTWKQSGPGRGYVPYCDPRAPVTETA